MQSKAIKINQVYRCVCNLDEIQIGFVPSFHRILQDHLESNVVIYISQIISLMTLIGHLLGVNVCVCVEKDADEAIIFDKMYEIV